MVTSSFFSLPWRVAELAYLTDDPIDFSTMVESATRPSDGAAVVFTGAVRDHHEGRAVESIVYEAYRPMAEKEIALVIAGVTALFPDVRTAVAHRLGKLHVGEVSIVVVCTSPHRAEAFDACRATIDQIKKTVPIWKKERTPEGDTWVGWQGGHDERE